MNTEPKRPELAFSAPEEPNEVTFAERRSTTRTYISKSFTMAYGQDAGHPARYVYRVFDEEIALSSAEWEWTNHVVSETPGGRKQVQLQIAREKGVVRRLRIQKVPTSGDRTRMQQVLELNREQTRVLLELVRAVEAIPVEGDTSIHVDDQLLSDIFAHPDNIASVYAKDPDRFRAMIQSDAKANDVVALQHRLETVALMRSWLDDRDAFESASAAAGGQERAWQRVLEENPWVLGISLGGQLFQSWDHVKLEQTVAGASFQGVGKRVDALLRTAGIIKSLAFAEVKHHKTPLLGEEYRSGSWSPSKEVTGGVVQVQQTVHLASQQIGDYVQEQTSDGELKDSETFVLKPRSYLIAGTLDQLTGTGGRPVLGKVRSFELFRRNLHDPEVITFDELVARAEWQVKTSVQASEAD